MRYVLWGAAGALVGALLFHAAQSRGSAPYTRDAKLQRCMVYLPAMKDAKLRRWCLKQSERMP